VLVAPGGEVTSSEPQAAAEVPSTTHPRSERIRQESESVSLRPGITCRPELSEFADLVGELPGNELQLDVLGVKRAAGR
jgi:hypothetical protein